MSQQLHVGVLAWLPELTTYTSRSERREGNQAGLAMARKDHPVQIVATEESSYGFGTYAAFHFLGVRPPKQGHTAIDNLNPMADVESLAYIDLE